VSSDKYGADKYPWERLDRETSNNYAAFVTYRDQGPRRTLRKSAMIYYSVDEAHYDPMGGGIRTLQKWSSEFRWVARSEEYDDWLQNLSDATDVADIKSMRTRHATIATIMQNKVAIYLNTLDDAKIARMSPDSAMRLLDLAIKNERLARGVPDSIQALTNKDGGPLEVDVSEEALERKFAAFMLSRDPTNDIERGEPDGADDVGDDILAETIRIKAESAEGVWPTEDPAS
jgi:hypothetical protein